MKKKETPTKFTKSIGKSALATGTMLTRRASSPSSSSSSFSASSSLAPQQQQAAPSFRSYALFSSPRDHRHSHYHAPPIASREPPSHPPAHPLPDDKAESAFSPVEEALPPAAGEASASVTVHLHEDSILSPFGLASKAWPAASVLTQYFLDKSLDGGGSFFPFFLSPANRRPTPSGFARSSRIRVMELGSGTGFAGICLAQIIASLPPSPTQRAVDVVITDLPEVVPLMQANIEANPTHLRKASDLVDVVGSTDCGGTVSLHARALAWGDSDHLNSILAEYSSSCTPSAQRHPGASAPFDLVFATDVVYYPHLFELLIQTLVQLTPTAPAPPRLQHIGNSPRPPHPDILIANRIRELSKELPFYVRLGKYFDFYPVDDWDPFWKVHRKKGFVVFWLKRKECDLEWDGSEEFESLLMNWMTLDNDDEDNEEDGSLQK
ncbi:putative methyltransferase-domain-containing protein [Zopfochytrium polystomum]|nr:putative methyltransferase-domain-containing protein [Zopfochytrium polystomum]